jgi:hypothetical protein
MAFSTNDMSLEIIMSTGPEAEVKKGRNRSPNHPAIDLREAVERTAAMREKYALLDVPVHLAHSLWGYKEHGSAGNQCVAALKAFGLIDVKGEGLARKIAVSPAGERIVRNAPDRTALLKAAALAPAVHSEVVEHYRPHDIPAGDDLLHQYLVWDRPDGSRFNEDAVEGFISRLRSTLAFAGIRNTDTTAVDIPNDALPPASTKVGNYVQWTKNGVDQFDEPAKVLGVSDDSEYVFVEGSDDAIPMNQIAIANPPAAAFNENPPVRNPPKNPFANTQPKPPKHGGPFISFPLTADNVVELRLSSRVSKKDFDRLKKLIDLSEDSLVQQPDE